MATWANVQTITSPGTYYDYDNVNTIYYTKVSAGNYYVYQYNVSTDTETQLSNDASWPNFFANGLSAPVYFAGNLYFVVREFPGTEVRIYRYSGAGTAWTQVLSVARPVADSAFTYFLSRTSTQLIFVAVFSQTVPPTGDIPVTIRYSSDGSSWSTGSDDGIPDPPTGYTSYDMAGYNPDSTVSPASQVPSVVIMLNCKSLPDVL